MALLADPMEVVPGSTVGHTAYNGVTRQIPGTQNRPGDPVDLKDEPAWMKLSTVGLRHAPAYCGYLKSLGPVTQAGRKRPIMADLAVRERAGPGGNTCVRLASGLRPACVRLASCVVRDVRPK